MAVTDLFQSPALYIAFQRLIGGARMRSVCLRKLAPKEGERILDIGCGPAYYLPEMPSVDYHGFDTDAPYIEYARSRFGRLGTFHCETFSAEHAARLGHFDGVLLMGLLHHLDDEACNTVLRLVASVLKPEGRAIALDTTLHKGQNRLERMMAVRDRGKYVRRPEEFEALAKSWFGSVEGSVSAERFFPAIHWSMTMRRPRKPERR